ncbi:unnamed protein product [Soboliphyme baturini]|uniref:J domain-containing protein n=1 Tax=Soboliphyme baturini TaxID=241478 RepID=A0A183IRN1_9BILA|nr:unnamed protein product [Soboliphyme baturini]
METLYNLLEVSASCSRQEAKAAYFRLLRKFHPDRSAEGNVERLQAIAVAWKVIGDECSRKVYDRWLQEQELRLNSGLFYETVSLRDVVDEKDMKASLEAVPSPVQIDCRCGGCFVVDPQLQFYGRDNVLVPCSNCSLNLRVTALPCDDSSNGLLQS